VGGVQVNPPHFWDWSQNTTTFDWDHGDLQSQDITSSWVKAGKQISISVNINIGRTSLFEHSIMFYTCSPVSLHLTFSVEVSFS